MEILVGIDVGTSSCKVAAVNSEGKVISTGSYVYYTSYPRPGWAEQNPEDWYTGACQATKLCIKSGKINPADVVGISVDGPAHNVALLDERDQIIYPTIHWSDLRSVAQSEWLEQNYGKRIFEITFQNPNPSWTFSQLLWLKEKRSGIWHRLHKILVNKDFVRYRLTGEYQTDVYDAIGTQLYDIVNNNWSTELCDILEFPTWRLPIVLPATSISGKLTQKAAGEFGLVPGIPIAVGSGDSVVEAFGVGALEPGHCIIKLGTAGNVNLVTASPHQSSKVLTYPHIADGRWFTIAATNSGAATMRWFRRTFCRHEEKEAKAKGISVYELIGKLAKGAPVGSDGLLFHPYIMGERTPYWDPHLRGDFIGIRASHQLKHFARAVLEGVAYSLLDCFKDIEKLGQHISEYRLIGGGTKSQLWRQILCHVFGKPLVMTEITDTSYGSALLAGVAVGIFPSLYAAASRCVQIREILYPDESLHTVYSKYFDIYRSVTRDLAIHCHRLAELNESVKE